MTVSMTAAPLRKVLGRVLPRIARRRPRFGDRLLVTDDHGDAAIPLFGQVLILGGRTPDGVAADDPAPCAGGIVCHVALDDPATLAALEAALAALAASRPLARDSADALTVVLRGDDPHALADRLGATRVIVAGPDGPHWTERLDAAPAGFGARPPAPAADTIIPGNAIPGNTVPGEAEAVVAAAVLEAVFAAATQRAPISMAEVDRGAAAVLRGVRDDIRGWIEVVRRYDDSTYQHCLLVAGFCAALARKVGFSTARQHLVVQAALLHDIGKARVPLVLLNKPGALTAAEAAVVRRHPTDGYYMLAGQSDVPAVIRDVVVHHHELLDGSGYPHRLKSAQIIEEVRLATVCDIYAALVERRPYRQPMAAPAAMEVLVAMGGKLDAMFVAALGAMLEAPHAPDLAAAS